MTAVSSSRFGFHELALFEQEGAQAVVEVGLVRPTAQETSVGLDRLLLLSRLCVEPGKERPALHVVGFFPEVALQKSDRPRIVAFVLQSPDLGKLGLRSGRRGEGNPGEGSAQGHALLYSSARDVRGYPACHYSSR